MVNFNRFSFTIVTITLTVIYMYVSSNVAVKSVLQFSCYRVSKWKYGN